jgi:aspartate/methionine/tyrosine aminotransferase
MSYFQFKPIRAARVSEISETTAAAPIPKEERVNFHIGNPVLDSKLSSAYLRIALGIEIHKEELNYAQIDAILESLGWEPDDKPKLEFLIRIIQNSAPYMPRGGYNREDPHPLVKAFCSWLSQQQEPLHYDTGEQSAKREIILATGGITEVLRIILFVISSYQEVLPARILSYRCEIPQSFKTVPNLIFEDLSNDERVAQVEITKYFEHQPEVPTFLLIGGLLEEDTRRKLRLLSIERPLFFIEANNAPNHLSLAREAKLVQRVIRLLSPAIFAPRLHSLSTVFIAGNADFLSVIENVHFNLKGTPSASETELLNYLLDQRLTDFQHEKPTLLPEGNPTFDGLGLGITAEAALPRLAERIESNLDRFLNSHSQAINRSLTSYSKKSAVLEKRIQIKGTTPLADEFSSYEANDLLELLIQNIHDPTWSQDLQRSFLSNFVRHQPQYQPDACLVTSGSSRTALGILGFHCGISEVIIPDLSWSYDQCFLKTYAVPLTEKLELDVNAIIEKIQELLRTDPSWNERGAVVINSPHNATGQIFDEDDVRKLILYSLQNNLYVIDDLAYQNVAPTDDLLEIKTARQITEELVRTGALEESQGDRVITVQSISKSDCLAGARLAVVEIRDPQVRQRFEDLNSHLLPNLAAIFISYLFYRSSRQTAQNFWHMRNMLLFERSTALVSALENLPRDRNPFELSITPPRGSMYPLLQVEKLPDGVSLDWLASTLARQGIGLLPLSTFSRTEKGFETGRKTFRLTLGGSDNAEILLAKTRRLLIDLNRLIAEEKARYNRKKLHLKDPNGRSEREAELSHAWFRTTEQIHQQIKQSKVFQRLSNNPHLDGKKIQREFLEHYFPERLEVFRARLLERSFISDELMRKALTVRSEWLPERLHGEFTKDSLQRRQKLFRMRSYDRTVHPTQTYSLQAEIALDAILAALNFDQPIGPTITNKAGHELLNEYLGQNVSITSQDEADEIKLDLATLTAAEDYTELFSAATLSPLLSFWSDWDGSNRPSGQGQQLIASIVMENVRRMARIIFLLRQTDPTIPLDPDLVAQINQLPEQNQRFSQLLNKITLLTHQLEQRYRGILPYSMDLTPIQRWATRWNLRRDPTQVLLQHNDRYERKMLELRQQRLSMLEHYFALNKHLRKQIHRLIPEIQTNRYSKDLLREVVGFRDLLQRSVITPRIHQSLITARDQFGIDTTVHNLDEINTISGKYGNPGMILALQVSMSSKPDALISLDRKFRIQRQQIQRKLPSAELPSIWLIPLFESLDAVGSIPAYLDRIWDYSTQSRRNMQSPQERFSEIISEVFIAGSDLSQQVSQATGAHLYRKAKYQIQTWLAEQGVAEAVRLKLGSGESMQRQGGYYSESAGQPAFILSEENKRRFERNLPASARKSTAYATTPLQGVFLGGDLRTFQSNLSEKLRLLPVRDFANLLHHVSETQRNHRNDLIRASETITESRLGAQSRSLKELERLTIGSDEAHYESFLEELTDNFRHILYGKEEDVIGIHAISYFIGRSLPQLRDRPTSRRKPGQSRDQSRQIISNIAEIIPFEKQGSLLRAISHNQAQTKVLGINQLSTGLFRALERFAQKSFGEAEKEKMISEHLLPNLPVYEILNTLRLYQDWRGEFLGRIETAFPAGNSAFVALREDSDTMQRYLPLFQQELLRRHGLNVGDFFTNGIFIPALLPSLRPDIAVLLQKNLFNTNLESLLEGTESRISDEWRAKVTKLLHLPEQIHYWRSTIWEVLGASIYQRVQSFAELATALYTLPLPSSFGEPPEIVHGKKIPPALTGFFRTARVDDEMRQFLLGTLEYLNSYANGNIEVPISIIRAMNDVERLAQIEESPLSPQEKKTIRFCMLKIAHLVGENG